MNADDRALITQLIESTANTNNKLGELLKLTANLGEQKGEHLSNAVKHLSNDLKQMHETQIDAFAAHVDHFKWARDATAESNLVYQANIDSVKERKNPLVAALVSVSCIRIVIELAILAAVVYPVIERLN